MTVDRYTLIKRIFALDEGASDFSDPDEQPTEFALGAIALAAELCGISRQEIRDELTDFAEREEAGQRVEDDLQYGDLDQDGQFPHESNPT